MIYAALPLSGDYGTLEVLAFHGDVSLVVQQQACETTIPESDLGDVIAVLRRIVGGEGE